MRKILIPSLMFGLFLSGQTFAQANDSLNYNLVNVQADATRKINNDEMHAVLFIEKSNKQPAQLANDVNQLMNQALNLARKYPSVKVQTGTQSTYPIYNDDNQKLKEWRSRAEVRLDSTDFKATSQLMSELQNNFQTEGINFSVSDAQRKKVEADLINEASKNFQQRAQQIASAWNKSGYQLVNLNLNTNNNSPRPMLMRSSSAKFAMAADSVESQQVAGGESEMTVSANGSIQLK